MTHGHLTVRNGTSCGSIADQAVIHRRCCTSEAVT
jgi:hypothetical protein